MNILNDEIRINCKTEESKESNGNLLTMNSNKSHNNNSKNKKIQILERKLTENSHNSQNSINSFVNKSKKGKIFYEIQNFSYFFC